MTANLQEQHQRLLAHYIRLAQTKGWKKYTWERLQQLAREPMYSDFPTLVTQALAVSPQPSSLPTAPIPDTPPS